jgi:hypothetical protein
VADRQTFRRRHRDARERWRAGDRQVVFPAGTWKMRIAHGALVETLSAAA